MARPNPIRELMAADLPSITYQRRKQFRPQYADVIYAYNIINRHVFENLLRLPKIEIGQLRHTWGECHWLHAREFSSSQCEIYLTDKWFCQQWFINVLAHEMIHQWQWDHYRWEHQEIHGRDLHLNSGGHGPSFFAWRDRFADYGLTLKVAFGQKRWFKHQDFTKC